MMLAEQYKIVPVAKEIDVSGTVYTDSINMENYHSATFLFQLTALGTAGPTLTVNSGASNAACTSPMYFNYAFGGAAIGTAVAKSVSAASCDVLAAWTNAATLVVLHTYTTYMLVVEVEAASMDTANGEYFLTCKFVEGSSGSGTVSAFAILRPRYPENRIFTCLA